jgi:hypothetical protein
MDFTIDRVFVYSRNAQKSQLPSFLFFFTAVQLLQIKKQIRHTQFSDVHNKKEMKGRKNI